MKNNNSLPLDYRSTLQKPIDSGFTAFSTAEEVIAGIDLTGKVAIVTGGYAGIGLETVRVLHNAGAHIIVPARDINKAMAALKNLSRVEVREMDLMNPDSVSSFTKDFIDSGKSLNILVNSAGIMASPLMRDSRGYEAQFSTNHLGHFQLTLQLWSALVKSKDARVVSVSLWGHRQSAIDFDDPNFERRDYNRMLAYGQSKTANILFAVALDWRGKNDNIRAFSLHPGGIVSTDLKRYFTTEELELAGMIDKEGKPILDPERSLKTIAQGAATSVWCATNPVLNGMGGVYCENSNIAPLVPSDALVNQKIGSLPLGVMPYAIGEESAEKLWELSEKLTGVVFN
ncbi:MAG: SDR family NAD(P)-dependent oxidoreductase [Flavobacterium sp.]|nr:SDR family NAD(P)-dependent oxidoreductase [Flavobacterium sp.]